MKEGERASRRAGEQASGRAGEQASRRAGEQASRRAGEGIGNVAGLSSERSEGSSQRFPRVVEKNPRFARDDRPYAPPPPVRLLACSPARLLTCLPARLLACSPARLIDNPRQTGTAETTQ